jgi:hypothetical protein
MDSFLFLDFSDSMRWQPFSFHSPNQTNQQRAELMLFPTQKRECDPSIRLFDLFFA